jgi:hypothetical protein
MLNAKTPRKIKKMRSLLFIIPSFMTGNLQLNPFLSEPIAYLLFPGLCGQCIPFLIPYFPVPYSLFFDNSSFYTTFASL